MIRIAVGCILLALAGCQTPPRNPADTSPDTLRAYLLGHWFREAFGDKFNRFEIEYRSDGSVTAYQFRPVYHNRIPTAVPLIYEGRWQIIGAKLIHNWKPNSQVGDSFGIMPAGV